MKKILFLAFLIMSGSIAFAQDDKPVPPKPPKPPRDAGDHKKSPRREKVEAMKIGYITQQLELTPEEAQRFWPVYNQYTEKERALRKTHRAENKEAAENIDKMSDKEIEAMVDNEIIYRQKDLDLQKEYHKQFKAVLPPRKVAKLYRAEEMFKRELVRKLQEGNR